MPNNYYRQMPCQGVLYQVQPGDSFFRIAQRFGVSLQSLRAANPQIQNPALIFVGQIICVPVQVACPREIDGFIYTVLPGDTLSVIARQFDVSLEDILNVNLFITNPNLIFAGQRICIPEPGVRFPCCAILMPAPEADLNCFAKGTVLIQANPAGGVLPYFCRRWLTGA